MDFTTLNKSGAEPIYQQIYRVIAGAIRSGDLTAGGKLPSVNELIRLTGVSRMTVLQSLQLLENEGCIYSVAGKGTFVSRQLQVFQNLQALVGWTEEMKRQGFSPLTRLVDISRLPANAHAAASLRVSEGTTLIQVVRVRGVDQIPLAVERARLVASRFSGIERFLLEGKSLYKTLQEQYGVIPHHAIQVLDACEMDAIDAELLGVIPGRPGLFSERITYSAVEEPLELVRAVHKPGMIRFRSRLNLTAATAREVSMGTE